MKKSIILCLLLLLSASVAVAQDLPFDSFRKAVKEERGGFAGNKENLSKIFNAERIRLGQSFETELWKYLESDADKHFWISSFITAKSYLHGNAPLSELAFRIRTIALELLKDKNDKRSLGRKVTINRHLAVSSKLARNQIDAVRYRDNAEALVAKHDDIGAYISGRTDYDICIYQNITESIDGCLEDKTPKEKIITRGWLNSQVLAPVKPIYPTGLKGKETKAQVDVRIVTDTAGNVISAEIIRGPSEFHKAATEAAMKAKFGPVTLSGQPVKTSGWLSIVFTP